MSSADKDTDLEKDNKTTRVGIEPAGKSESSTESKNETPTSKKKEIGGRKKGLEPTRYGDWEKNGRCIDF